MDEVKRINDLCIKILISKKCKCRNAACFHSGQLDLALKILILNKVDIGKLRK